MPQDAETPAPEFDFWTDRLKIACGGYSEVIDRTLYNIADALVHDRRAGLLNPLHRHNMFNEQLAERFSLQPAYVELIQYILASVKMPNGDPFTYGTSPRGLFVDHLPSAEQFLQELKEHRRHWSKSETG